jgi:hypothetical protein
MEKNRLISWQPTFFFKEGGNINEKRTFTKKNFNQKGKKY